MEEFEMEESVIDYNNNPEEYNEFMRAVRNVEILFRISSVEDEIEIDDEIDEIDNEIEIIGHEIEIDNDYYEERVRLQIWFEMNVR